MNNYKFIRPKKSLVLAYATNATTISTTAALNGLLYQAIITVPNLDSTNTATFNLKDADSNVVYTKAAIAKSTTSINLLTTDTRVPLVGTYTLEMVTSGSQTADRTFTVVLLIEQG